jgi:uncharacterized glyoxalase superfamily protein PhnB
MPSLAYEDVVLALGWLDDAFGFREHLRWADEEGIVRHAEMRIEDAFVELSQASSERPTPKVLGHTSQSIIVTVDNVDSHYLRALASGALIIAEPEDKPWGLRQYTAEDLDGHLWEFSQYLRHVPPTEWGAQLRDPDT